MRDPGASAQHDSGASGPEAVPEVSTPPLSNLAYRSGPLGASRGKGNSLIFLLLVKTPWSGPLYGDSSPVRLAWVTSPVMGRGHREEAGGGPGVPAQGETVAETLSREVFPGAYRKPGGGIPAGKSLHSIQGQSSIKAVFQTGGHFNREGEDPLPSGVSLLVSSISILV